jgi:hypothetical protein
MYAVSHASCSAMVPVGHFVCGWTEIGRDADSNGLRIPLECSS